MVVKQQNDFNTIKDISDVCHSTNNCIMIQESGNDDFVVMSAEKYRKKQFEIHEENKLNDTLLREAKQELRQIKKFCKSNKPVQLITEKIKI